MTRERNPELPPLPYFRLTDVQFTTATLTRAFREYRDQRVTPALALRMAIDAGKALDGVPEVNLHQTFIQYTGQVVDERLEGILAAQMAAREGELSRAPIVAYDRPTKPEWVAMEVVSVTPAVWRENEAGTIMGFKAMSGHPAGHLLKRKFPNPWLNFFAYQVGFSRRIEFDLDPRHFLGLMLWGYLVPVVDSPEIKFDDWDLSSAFKKHNLRVIRLRTRLDYELADCPNGFDHHCFECPVGRDECPASCRSTSTHHPPSSTQARAST